MTRRQNRIAASLGLLPDGDTGHFLLGDTRQHDRSTGCGRHHYDIEVKGY